MTENIVHRKYKILKDAVNDIWDRVSMWHAAEDIEVSTGLNLETDLADKTAKINALYDNLAPTETSPAASAHAVGSMIVYNGVLYRVISAISAGNTLAVGTNIEAKTAGAISKQLVASDGTEFYFDYYGGKYGYYPNASKTASQFVAIT